MARQATVLISEDGVRLEFDGKFTVVGLFTGNIGIPASSLGSILHFLVIVEGDVDQPSTSLSIEILMPGANPTRFDFPAAQLPFAAPFSRATTLEEDSSSSLDKCYPKSRPNQLCANSRPRNDRNRGRMDSDQSALYRPFHRAFAAFRAISARRSLVNLFARVAAALPKCCDIV